MIFLKSLSLLFLINLILCGSTQSQSIFLDVNDLKPVYSHSSPHGFGVEPLSKFNAEASYSEACEAALKELNSNLFLSIYIEQFTTGAYSNYLFPELSIRDTTLAFGENIIKADSFRVASNAYCIATLDEKKPYSSVSIPNLKELKVGPVKANGFWYAMGIEKGSRFNPYASWIKSKNYALKDLAWSVVTLVQSSMINVDYSFTEFTYLKSYVIFKDVSVLQRFITSDNEFISIIAVKESDIMEVN